MSEYPSENEILNQIEINTKLDKNVKIWNNFVSKKLQEKNISDIDIYDVCNAYCEKCELSTVQQVFYGRLKYTRNCNYNYFRAAVISMTVSADESEFLKLMTLSGNPLHPGEDKTDATILTAAQFAVKEESAKRKLDVFCDVLDVAINNDVVVRSELNKTRRKASRRK